MAQDELKWSAPEFEYYPKNKSWFLVVSLLAAILFIWPLLTKNFIFAILIGLAYFSIIVYGQKKPNEISLAISAEGVKVNKTLYNFDSLKSFWIFYDNYGLKELSLRSKKNIMPYVKVPLGEVNPVDVRRILLQYLPERKHQESFVDNLTRNLRF